MNLLNFIDKTDLEAMKPQFVNLHTRNKDNAVNQCKNFFANYIVTTKTTQFFTATSNYQYYGGYQYNLKQMKNGTLWLVRVNDEYFEI